LYQNALYETIPPRRRELLHRQAGEILARSYCNDTDRIAGALAMHFEKGRVFPRAIEYLIKAAEIAASRYANDAADQHYSNALRLVDRLPEDDRLRIAAAVRRKRGSARMMLRKFEAAEDDFREMLNLGRELNDPVLQCRSLILLSQKHFLAHEIDQIGARAEQATGIAELAREPGLVAEASAHLARRPLVLGRLDEAKTIAGRGVMLARSVGDCKALSEALLTRGSAHFFQSEYRQAAELLDETVKIASELFDGVTLPLALMFLGLTRGNAGEISGALASLRQWEEISQRNSSEPALMRIPNCLAWIYGEMQDFDTAIRHNSEGIKLARRGGMVEAEANSLINLLQAFTQTGELENAGSILIEIEALFGRDPWHQWRFFEIRYNIAAADYWLSRGDPARSAVHAREGLRNAASHSAAKHEASARNTLAAVEASAGDCQAAESDLLAALDALRNRPAPLVAWKTFAGLGRLYQKMGKGKESRAAFIQAAAIVSGIAATVDEGRLKQCFLNSPAALEVTKEASEAI
jgi:tetratricopeptide (TPR) repeat protein